MLIIADSSALIAIATCDGLDLLLQVYEEIKIPEAVYAEIVAPEKSYADALGAFLVGRVVKVQPVQSKFISTGLGRGEIEAMSLYNQISADILLIDDQKARSIAEQNEITCIGVLGFLVIAKQKGVIKKIKPYIQRLEDSPIYYGDELLKRVLQIAKE
ncbi:MAG: DUF3368 domain-containing protein [Anaerolineales bacterium]|nr:DUF3368 domain-containing protein [Anaerolineales bacterium]MBX3038062.1 DUF3368 domain-containing protein [Anaerolineales bacterium]